ncbi:MAG: NAD-dependent epimerase/dehydratase family protein [Acidobacteriota bacterium]|nr:NAD-dependent epimerase/dehydratase family protein [Acidobacteriota bacterium]
MGVAIITGSLGLIGAEAALYFANLGLDVVGIDNDMRSYFFGQNHSTAPNQARLAKGLGKRYRHLDLDIRDRAAIDRLFAFYGSSIALVIHTAAQPSHDWAAREPLTDFEINATGTLNLLEAVRRNAPNAVFIFTSTNKVYGDSPNRLPIVEHATRFEVEREHPHWEGIGEDMSLDHCLHSLFGVSKTAADLLVQEYGRYFNLPTVCFRGGTLTGPDHAAAQLHGFLAYLMHCTVTRTPYTVFGFKGKQVRDVIHCRDVVKAFHAFWRAPRCAAVYNIGGGRTNNCSVLEAIDLCQKIAGVELDWTYQDQARVGDHIWWISSLERFQQDYPEWRQEFTLQEIASQIADAALVPIPQ